MPSLSSRQFLAVLAHGDGIERVALEIESRAGDIGAARRFVRRQLAAWDLSANDNLVDRVVLVVSELVTNAVVHGRTRPPGEKETVGVALAYKQDVALGLLVTDNSDKLPIPELRPSADDVRGRGLTLVDAQSDSWTAVARRDRRRCRGEGRMGLLPLPLGGSRL